MDTFHFGPSTETPPRNSRSDRQQRRRARRGANRNSMRNREGFFMHYLFVTLTVRYAGYFKPTVRRLIEFFTLIKALMMLTLLIYVHITFVKDSGHCLDSIEDVWPRDGILKVQVEANTTMPKYQYFFAKARPETWATSFQMDPYQAVFKYSVKIGRNGDPLFFRDPPVTYYDRNEYAANNVFHIPAPQTCPVINISHFKHEEVKNLLLKKFAEVVPEIRILNPDKEEDIPSWVLINPAISDTVAEIRSLQMQEMSGFNIGPQPVRDYYAIEYSPEFGYLRLSSVTRFKLGIPVMVVTLDPHRDTCFGKGVKRWMLDTFFGYDDLVMGSIKSLAEKANKDGGGYLRNLVTGEHFKFITLGITQASYVLAFSVMIVFTLVVTMLLRYSYHQIFVFMVQLLHVLDTDATPVFPAAPMLTIILALVGTEEIMTEFFHDSTLAFYVILSIWIADQFDAICMHTVVSRRHWVRFFFLYHFSFYLYHYRYNGQFSELALFTSWLFIQHSMFYFLHHYEIPAIQRQIRVRQILFQNNNNNNASRNNSPNVPPAPPRTPPDAPPNTPTRHLSDGESNNNSNIVSNPNSDSPQSSAVDPPTDNDADISSNNQNLSIREDNIMLQSNSDCEIIISNLDRNMQDVEFWRHYPEVLNGETVVRNAAGFSKYCHLLMVLFFALSSLILVFSLTILMLNQGRFGAKFARYNLEKMAGFVY